MSGLISFLSTLISKKLNSVFELLLAGVCSIGGRIYIVGGNDGTSFLNTCEAYDPVSDKWSEIAPMCTARAGIGCAVQDGIIYVAGMGLCFIFSVFSYTVISKRYI